MPEYIKCHIIYYSIYHAIYYSIYHGMYCDTIIYSTILYVMLYIIALILNHYFDMFQVEYINVYICTAGPNFPLFRLPLVGDPCDKQIEVHLSA
jgi:hypothetical protein